MLPWYLCQILKSRLIRVIINRLFWSLAILFWTITLTFLPTELLLTGYFSISGFWNTWTSQSSTNNCVLCLKSLKSLFFHIPMFSFSSAGHLDCVCLLKCTLILRLAIWHQQAVEQVYVMMWPIRVYSAVFSLIHPHIPIILLFTDKPLPT